MNSQARAIPAPLSAPPIASSADRDDDRLPAPQCAMLIVCASAGLWAALFALAGLLFG